jgi:hypothetical protein
MGQVFAAKERNIGRSKWLYPFVKGLQRLFCADRIANEDGEKINELIRSASRTGKTNLFLNAFENARCGQDLGYDGNFSKPVRN